MTNCEHSGTRILKVCVGIGGEVGGPFQSNHRDGCFSRLLGQHGTQMKALRHHCCCSWAPFPVMSMLAWGCFVSFGGFRHHTIQCLRVAIWVTPKIFPYTDKGSYCERGIQILHSLKRELDKS